MHPETRARPKAAPRRDRHRRPAGAGRPAAGRFSLSVVLGLAALALLPTEAPAGAWPREEGTRWALLQHDTAGGGWSSLYAEHGLTGRLTYGLDVGASNDGLNAKAMTFARRAVPPPPLLGGEAGPWHMAIQGGVGSLRQDGHVLPAVRLGSSLGRGVATPLGEGWVNVDVHGTVTMGADPETLAPRPETGVGLDAVAGLRPWAGTTLALGLEAQRAEDGTNSARLVPYGLRRFGRWEALVGATLSTDADPGLRVGLAVGF